MDVVAALVRRIDRLNEAIGRAVSWLSLAMVLIAGFVVVARYGFAWGRVWLQESYVWMHGVLFMLAAGYTLRHDAHVRVDIFYRPAGARFKAWVDLLGSLLLLAPVVVFAGVVAFPYVRQSWLGLEASRGGGRPARAVPAQDRDPLVLRPDPSPGPGARRPQPPGPEGPPRVRARA